MNIIKTIVIIIWSWILISHKIEQLNKLINTTSDMNNRLQLNQKISEFKNSEVILDKNNEA